MKLFKKIVDKKHPKEEMRYIFKDEGAFVGTDARRLLIVETAYQGTSYVNIAGLQIPSAGVNIVGETEGYIRFQCDWFKYPNWQRIVPTFDKPMAIELENDANIAICQIAQAGLYFDVTFIQDLFKSGLYLNNLELEYGEDRRGTFVIKGQMDAKEFTYIVMPIQK